MNIASTRNLQKIDWDFSGTRKGYVPPPHWWPGTFIPELPTALIEALTKPGDTVLDPFCGIGTTGWASMNTGRRVRLVDANPIAVLTATFTACLLVENEQQASSAALLGTIEAVTAFGEGSAGELSLDRPIQIRRPGPQDEIAARALDQCVRGAPKWDLLKPWFDADTLGDIRVAFERIMSENDPVVRLGGLVMCSATLRTLSSQNASWGHIADNVRPKRKLGKSATKAYKRWLTQTGRFVAANRSVITRTTRAEFDTFLWDWSSEQSLWDDGYDLLLTSPPYAGAIDYTLAQRLSLFLLGYDEERLAALVADETGARRKRSKGDSTGVWARNLCDAVRRQVQGLRTTGHAAFVLPHKDAGREVGETSLRSMMADIGWVEFFRSDRSIHQSRTRQSWTSIQRETIVAYRYRGVESRRSRPEISLSA